MNIIFGGVIVILAYLSNSNYIGCLPFSKSVTQNAAY